MAYPILEWSYEQGVYMVKMNGKSIAMFPYSTSTIFPLCTSVYARDFTPRSISSVLSTLTYWMIAYRSSINPRIPSGLL